MGPIQNHRNPGDPSNTSAVTEASSADSATHRDYARLMTTIASGTTVASVAALIGDVARANILFALMGGRALTASELAWHSGVTAQTASGHLAKLLDAGLIAVEKQGRHRYYRLATQEAAGAIEALMAVAALGPKRHRPTGPKDEAMRAARTCYDHLAGQLAVALADMLCERDYIVLSDGAGAVTAKGETFLSDFGIDLVAGAKAKRPLCRTCLDWSERRPHLAGRLGAALLDRCLALGWIARIPSSRTIRITQDGRDGFTRTLGAAPDWLSIAAR
jgi:DNA-binding transcriptional ArsR family regulator